MTKYSQAFLDGYTDKSIEKEALSEALTAVINSALDKGFWAAIAAPAVVGIGGGTLIGMLNDPNKKDIRILQKRLTNKIMKRNLAELARTSTLDDKDDAEDKRREIHI